MKKYFNFKELMGGSRTQELTSNVQNEVLVMVEEPKPITTKKPARKQYPKEVEEIHLAFNTEADKLLTEAQSILQKTTLDEVVKNKATLAQQLGFTRVKEVQAKHEHDEVVSKNKQIMEAVQEASKYIATNKWIPESSVKRICQQWGLLFGTPRMYKGFLPNVNLLEIQDFKNKYYDKFNAYTIRERFSAKDSWYFTDVRVSLDDIKKQRADWYGFSLREYENYSGEHSIPVNSLDRLNICAPVKDMDVPSSHTVEDGWKVSKVEVPDPIVLARRDFNGVEGYYIVTAWGDEAEDEEVVGYNK